MGRSLDTRNDIINRLEDFVMKLQAEGPSVGLHYAAKASLLAKEGRVGDLDTVISQRNATVKTLGIELNKKREEASSLTAKMRGDNPTSTRVQKVTVRPIIQIALELPLSIDDVGRCSG